MDKLGDNKKKGGEREGESVLSLLKERMRQSDDVKHTQPRSDKEKL